MEIVKDSIGLSQASRRTIRYKMWKQSLYKWDQYVANRHKQVKQVDSWSQYIIDSATGDSAVYNSGGMFFKEFLPDITVIEHIQCPIAVNGMTYLTLNKKIETQFDTLIMVNPIALKYHHSIKEFLTVAGISRAGNKPVILDWVKLSGQIFISFSDWHLYYDRLKFTPDEMIQQQLTELETIGLKCTYKQIDSSNLDYVNGNIKLVLSRNTVL